jgi:hypothetical protein
MANPIPDTGNSRNTITLNELNTTDLNDLESLLINYRQLLANSSTLVNNIGSDPESMAVLDTEQRSLEASRSAMNNRKTELATQKSNLLQKEILINGQTITLETWIASHPFNIWNYSNKINRIEVHFTSLGVMGMRVLYRDPTKAVETVGIVANADTTSQTTIQNVDFLYDEWLMQIQITNSSSNSSPTVPSPTLCSSISFYTSKNAPGTSPKVTIPVSTQSNAVQNKTYFIDSVRRPWLQHKSNAESQGAELACFENSAEMVRMLAELGNARFQSGGSFYIGLYHPNALIQNNNRGGGTPYNVNSNKNSTWKWVDNTPYNPNTTNWNGGEPNNWGNNENVAQMYSNGKINDLTKTYPLAAIYQRRIVNTTSQTIRKTGEHIKSFTISPLSVTYDFITSIDVNQRMNALSIADNTRQLVTQIENTATVLDNSIDDINDAIAKITANIQHIIAKRAILIGLNSQGDVFIDNYESDTTLTNQRVTAAQGFANIGGSENLFSSYMSNMREGFVEGSENMGSYISANQNAESEAARITGNLVRDIQSLKDTETSNAISEFVIKKDNIFTNVLTDYMLNDEKQNNLEGVYNKIDQQNTDKMRKIEINTYYDKAYKEYVNILKVIIFACVILVPIVIANKNSLLPNSITNILVVVIIFLTVIYIITKFVDIYMRDNKDFDKIRIPYDREAAILQKNGTIVRKNNLLSSFSLTCIGADCCPDPSSGMVYDPVKNRCVANETFADYFNTPIGGYLDETLNGYVNNSINGIMGAGSGQISIVEPFRPQIDLQGLTGTSLNRSRPNTMNASN